MWLFLDDFADNVAAGCYKKARIAGCCVLAAAAVASGALSVVKAKGQDALIAEADAKIAELQASITDGKVEKANLENNKASYYPVAEVCGKIAELQSSYGGYSVNTAMKDIETDIKATREELAAYMSDGSSGSPWFNMPTVSYTWKALNAADSTVRNVPVVWECTVNNGDIYAVCFGTFDGEMDRAGSFSIHNTRNGTLALGRPDPSAQEQNEDPSDVEQMQQNASENTENTENNENETGNGVTGTGTVTQNTNGQSVSSGTSGYDNGYSSGYNDGYQQGSNNSSSGNVTNTNQSGQTVTQDKRYVDLPAGYGNSDRASVADSSLDPADGRTPAVTQDELNYAKKLDTTVRNQFYALNHAARSRFMKEHPLDSNGNPTNLNQSTSGSSGSTGTSTSTQVHDSVGGTGTANMSNEDILKQIMQ